MVAPTPCRHFLWPISFGLLLTVAPVHAERVKVSVDGVGKELRGNIELGMSLAIAGKAKSDLRPGEIERLIKRAPGEVAVSLEPFGHYRSVTTVTIQEQTENQWRINVSVTPGPRIQLTSVSVAVDGPGASEPGFIQARDQFPVRVGDPLDHRTYRTGKKALVAVAADSGYLDAAFDTAAIWIDRERYDAGILIHFTTGERFYFGPVTFSEAPVDSAVLRGYVRFEPGDPFRASELMRLQGELSDIGYFSSVEVRPRRDLAEGTIVPVHVNLRPARTQRYDVGLGYGTDTGPRITLDLKLRRLNAAGHRAEFSGRFSAIENRLSARYLIPSRHPKTWLTAIQAGYAKLDPDAYTTRKGIFGPSFSHPRGAIRETFSLDYEYENYTIGVDDGVSRLMLPGVAWYITHQDNPLFARRGWRAFLEIKGAHESVLSTVSVVETYFAAKGVRALRPNIRLIGRMEFGQLWTDQFRKLPPTVRYLTGGDQSIRGYPYRTLGPLDEAGNVIGGDRLLTAGVELDFYPLKKWGIAGFFDAGNAFDDARTVKAARGVGAGLRWVSPVGLFRIDYAVGLDRDNDYEIHLVIGPDL